MLIYATYNIKGGVGKTTTAVNLAYLAAAEGLRTVLWDLDPQGAATFMFRVKPRVKGGGKAIIRGKRTLDEAIKGTDFDNLDLIPADFTYRNMDLLLDADGKGGSGDAGAGGKTARKLSKLLAPLAQEYDAVFLDCPPSISLVSENVLHAADVIVVPLIPTTLSVRTLEQLTGFVDEFQGRRPRVLAFFSMVDRRKKLHKEITETLFPERTVVASAVIPYLSVVENMSVERSPVAVYAPRSAAARAYRALWSEVRAAGDRPARISRMSLPAEAVVAASNDWIWIPEYATTVETDEYTLIRFPDYFDHPLELVRFQTARQAGPAVEDALARARGFGLPELYWMVRLDSPPAVTDVLLARGATVEETLDVLARDLSGGTPELPPPTASVELRWATDADSARDAAVLSAAVFGGSVPPADRLAEVAGRDAEGVPKGEGGTVVAYAGGVPVGSGGVTMADGVARLWGGGVAETARGQGVYRAVLGARLAYAAAQGANMALVKGRVQTSGPILRRAGFTAYGQELIYKVPLGLSEQNPHKDQNPREDEAGQGRTLALRGAVG